MAIPKPQPIIVIKKYSGHGGHNGGAWKVAYADFVTALMSLFIVLWLMGSSDKVKKAVAGYFNDPRGTGALLGTTMTGTGETVLVVAQETNMKELKEKLEQEIKAKVNLEKLSKQIEITITAEGLRIELIEGKDGTFYQSGSAQLSANGQELLAVIAGELKTLPNGLLIEGHTDATPYSTGGTYSNWELSADRANSARRIMQGDGVRGNQVTQVRGYADQFLRVKANPFDPSNRRISILVKNEAAGPPPKIMNADKVNGVAPSESKPAAGVEKTAAASSSGKAPAASIAPAGNSVAAAAKPAPAKPAAAKVAEKLGLIATLKGMLPGGKK